MRNWLIVLIVCLAVLAGIRPSRAADVETVAEHLQFPEGTIFVGDSLYFVDYSASSVLRLAGDKIETVWHQEGCGANGLVQVPEGLLVACYDDGTFVAISLDGRSLKTIGRDEAGQSFHSPNDLAADAKGGVYFTGSGSGGQSLGKVYYQSPDRTVKEVAANIHYANGLVVSNDGRLLYVAETERFRLLVFAIAADGSLGEQREFVKLADILADPQHRTYRPDGVRIDKRGNLFIGLYDGGGFAVIDPTGKLVKQIDLPMSHHATLAISPDNRFVYVTACDDTSNGGYRSALLRVPNPVAE